MFFNKLTIGYKSISNMQISKKIEYQQDKQIKSLNISGYSTYTQNRLPIYKKTGCQQSQQPVSKQKLTKINPLQTLKYKSSDL